MFVNRYFKSLFVLFMALTLLSGCMGPFAGKPEQEIAPVEMNTSAIAAPTEYLIQAGDKVSISVYGEDDLESEVVVSPDGGVTFPLVGDLQAKGKSVNELRTELKQKLSRYIPEAVVSVSLLEVVGNKVSVLGQVKKPGEYVLSGATDVMQALSMAGGVTPFASLSKVKILRRNQATQKQSVIGFNYKDVINGRNLEQNILLQSGDTVVVP